MTTENMTEVVCEDGETRPLSLCMQDYSGRWHLASELVELDCGDMAHPDDEQVVQFHDGIWGWYDDSVEVGGDYYHTHEAVVCHVCSCGVLRPESYASPRGYGRICGDCMDNECVSCAECGTTQFTDSHDLDDDGVCGHCRGEGGSLISSYGDKSANHLRSETKDRLKYGMELEVEGYDSAKRAAEYIRRFLPAKYCVLKRDGSLGPTGVEIVTRPDSMEVHKRHFAALFADSPGRSLSSWNTGRCGMHIHISRAALSQLQIGKMVCFLNDPGAVEFVSAVAGRSPGRWCKVFPKKIGDFRHDGDRYTALNVTGKHTVEVRIFKGTLAENSFYKNMEFVEALVAFTAPATRSIAQATSWRAFCEWLPKKLYPHLHAHLVGKGFIRQRRKAG